MTKQLRYKILLKKTNKFKFIQRNNTYRIQLITILGIDVRQDLKIKHYVQIVTKQFHKHLIYLETLLRGSSERTLIDQNILLTISINTYWKSPFREHMKWHYRNEFSLAVSFICGAQKQTVASDNK